MAELPVIYTVRLDLTEEVKEEFDQWAGTKHIDDLLGAGFLSAVRFRATRGEPEYLHLYELPNVELLSTEKYKDVGRNDATSSKLRHGVLNHSASLYEQVLTVNVPETPRTFPSPRTDSVGGVKSRHLATVRMDVGASDADELLRWHREEHFPRMTNIEGMVNARLCRRVATHPTTPCHDPEWVSIYELENVDVVGHPKVREANETDWAKTMQAKTSDVRFGVMERITPA